MICRWIAAGFALLISICVACEGVGKINRNLPADWPIPQLTLANDWELRREVAAMHRLDPAKYCDPQWIVLFDKDEDWAGVISHVESCLKPLDYLRLKYRGTNNPLGLDLPETRTYYSPDYLTEVYLTNGAYFDIIITTNIEFVVSITQRRQPPENIAAALNVKQSRPGSGIGEQLLDNILEPIR